MLTCINPSVTFKMKTGANNWVAYKGVAVALKWLLPLMKQFGGTHPPEERIRRDITTLGIGDGKGANQFFNKYADGTCISRRASGVDVIARKCVIIKHSSFGDESWKKFSEGKLKSRIILPYHKQGFFSIMQFSLILDQIGSTKKAMVKSMLPPFCSVVCCVSFLLVTQSLKYVNKIKQEEMSEGGAACSVHSWKVKSEGVLYH